MLRFFQLILSKRDLISLPLKENNRKPATKLRFDDSLNFNRLIKKRNWSGFKELLFFCSMNVSEKRKTALEDIKIGQFRMAKEEFA